MVRGIRLGIDVGKVRIGVAQSDPDGLLATPVTTVQRGVDAAYLSQLIELVSERECAVVYVGLPLSLSGEHSASTADAIAVASALEAELAVPVRLVDERLSTVTAQAALHQSGRNTKNSRTVIDQAAAVVILQNALDTERSQGAFPGKSPASFSA